MTDIPETQKAFVYSAFGSPKDVLELKTDIPVLPPKPHEVLIKVHSAALNPVDWKLMSGGAAKLVLRLPMTPGLDVAGTIVAVGSSVETQTATSDHEVEPFKVGDAVMAFLHFRNGPGALREYVNVDVSLVNHKPDRLSFDQAAAIPLASVTIWEALVIRGKMKKGDKVLINGASGGTGTAAVQLAKAFGATVVAVCSSRNAEFVKSLGADEVVDYETTKVYEQYTQQDFDIVLDCAGTYEELWAHEQTLVKRKGVFVRIVSKDHAMDSLVNLALSGSHYLLQSAYSWIRSGPSLHLFTATPSGKVLKQVTHCLVDENGFQPVIDSVYDFSPESVLQAFDKSASHRARGKIVIRVVQE